MLAHQIDGSSCRTKDVVIVENVTFESLLLSKNVLKGLTKNGFKKPSPVQLKAIPVGRCGFDLIVKSKSGTGKTLVFSVIALESLKLKQDKLEVLILSPTREIAVQSQGVIKLIGCYFKGLNVESFIGGLSVAEDKEKCKKCHIAVGTPGRIKQLITEKSLITDSVRLFVLDEADKLMEHSFRNDINEIYNTLPIKKQIITTSATYPNQLEEFLSKYMLSPTQINAETDSPLLLGLKQFVVVTKPTSTVVQLMKLKTEELIQIITNISFTQCLIFSNYQTRAESLSNILNQKGWPSTYISAAQTQTERLAAVSNLKDFKCRIMLSTDLTARGIDAANVDLVINYDIPIDAMTYLHRMGRAGRYGSTGVCVNLASEGSDLSHLQEILGYIGGTTLSIPKLPKCNSSIAELLKIEVPVEDHICSNINKEETDTNRSKIYEIMKKEEEKDVNVDILNILNKSKSEAEEIKQSMSDMDTDSILNSLLTRNFEMQPASEESDKITQKFDVNAVLKSLTDSTPKTPISKPKAPAKTAPSEIQIQEKKMDDLFTKNKALLDVSKILSGSSTSEDKISIEQHLSVMKKDTSDLLNILAKNENFQEITEIAGKNYQDDSEKLETLDITEIDCNVQNLFQFGYKNIVKADKKNWREALTEMLKTPIVINNDEEEDYEYESLENEDFVESDEDSYEKTSRRENLKQNAVNEEEEMIPDGDNKDEIDLERIKHISMEENTGAKKKVKNGDNDAINEEENTSLKKKGTKNKKSSRILTGSEVKNVSSEDCDEFTEDVILRSKNKGRKKKKKVLKEEDENSAEVTIMKWVPVEKDEKSCDTVGQTCILESHNNNEDSEEFGPYFEECSNNLWQNGMSFDSVEAFDEWFYYEWEAQLYSVRNYVQQNVYISEMAKYQNCRNDNKNS